MGKDVAVALGYSVARKAIRDHVDEEDKQILTFQNGTFESLDIPNRGLTIINESGLYSLVLSSKLPQAKVFKRWVTAEVLPSIRRHGAYAAAPTLGGRASPSTLTVCCPVWGASLVVYEFVDDGLCAEIHQSLVLVFDRLGSFQFIHQSFGKCRDMLLMALADAEVALQLVGSSCGQRVLHERGELEMVLGAVFLFPLHRDSHAVEGNLLARIVDEFCELSIEIAVVMAAEQLLISVHSLFFLAKERVHLCQMAKVFLVIWRFLQCCAEKVGDGVDIFSVALRQVFQQMVHNLLAE